MSFLTILIALLLERVMPQLAELRHFKWLRDYSEWLLDVLHIRQLNPWLALSVLLFPLLFITWLLDSMFDNAVFGLFELAFSVAILFFCLGPRELNADVEHYLDSIETGDAQQQQKQAGQLCEDPPADFQAQVISVSKALFVESNVRIYSVLFWFVLFGPLAVVLYRLLEQFLMNKQIRQSLQFLSGVTRILLSLMDWIPVRISVFAYMVSGRFEEGLHAYKSAGLSAVDSYETNHLLLQEVGFQSINSHAAGDTTQAMSLIRKSRGLILRALVVWLMLALFISLVS